MLFLALLWKLLAGHALMDFALQTEWIAEIPLSLSTYIAQCATRLAGGGAWIGERLGSAEQ